MGISCVNPNETHLEGSVRCTLLRAAPSAPHAGEAKHHCGPDEPSWRCWGVSNGMAIAASLFGGIRGSGSRWQFTIRFASVAADGIGIVAGFFRGAVQYAIAA